MNIDPTSIVQRGYDAWAAMPHNAKWVKRLDGTPIPNDLVVCIAEALRTSLWREPEDGATNG